jgi:hypothetical protein
LFGGDGVVELAEDVFELGSERSEFVRSFAERLCAGLRGVAAALCEDPDDV